MKSVLWIVLCALCAMPVSAQTSLLPTLEKMRGDYPTPMSESQRAELLNRVAWQHRADGWGLLRKTGGTRCPAPQGVDVACDILVHAPSVKHFDVLSDAEGAALVVWRDAGPCVPGPSSGCSMSNFLDPVGVADPGSELDILRKHVEELNAHVTKHREAIVSLSEALKLLAETLRSLDQSHREEIETLKARPIPTGCRASFLRFGGSCSLVY